MKILVNGQFRQIDEQTTLAALLDQMQLAKSPVAVEVNRAVIPRQQHAQYVLKEGDELEVVTLVGGGC